MPIFSEDNPILVLEAEKVAAFCSIRALAQVGYKIVAASHLKINPSFWSKYPFAKIHCPDIEENYDVYRKWLIKEVKLCKYITIFSFSDKTTQLLSEIKEILSEYTYIYQPDIKTVNSILDKPASYKIASINNINVPKTYDTECAINSIEYPVVVKPDRKVTYVNGKAFLHKVTKKSYVSNREGLVKQCDKLKKANCPYHLQQNIKGIGRGYFTIIIDGKPVVSLAHERLREYPITGGASTYRKTIDSKELEELSLPLIQSLKWNGPIMVEYKYIPEENKYYFMEVNGRWWGSLPLFINSGVNLPAIFIDYILKGATHRINNCKNDFYSRIIFPNDIMSLFQYILTFDYKCIVSWFKSSPNDDILYQSDLIPYLGYIFSMLKKCWK